MFKAIVQITESTGAGYGFESHIYATGKGVAISKSPKSAIAEARKMAAKNLGDSKERNGIPRSVGLIPVYDAMSLYKDNVKIL